MKEKERETRPNMRASSSPLEFIHSIYHALFLSNAFVRATAFYVTHNKLVDVERKPLDSN